MGDLYINIKNLCAKKGVSGSRMCLDLGMPKSFMTELGKGRHQTIKAETAQKIADYFEVPVEYVLTGEENKVAILSDEEMSLLNALRQIPENDREMILNVIRATLQSRGLLPEDKK